ncbi:hypothetical protein AGIG_G20113 [Arapaima gigas]
MASNQQQPPPASAEGKNPKTSKKPLTVSTKEPLYLLIDTHHKDQVLVCSPAQRSRRPEGPQSTKVAQRKTLHPLELPVAEHKDSPVPRCVCNHRVHPVRQSSGGAARCISLTDPAFKQ